MAIIVVKGVEEGKQAEMVADVKNVIADTGELDPDKVPVLVVPGSSSAVELNIQGLPRCVRSCNESLDLCHQIVEAITSAVSKYLQSGQSLMVQGYSMGQTSMLA